MQQGNDVEMRKKCNSLEKISQATEMTGLFGANKIAPGALEA